MNHFKTLKLTFLLALLITSISLLAKSKEDPYAITWETMQAHEVPEWFQDAKFGIYAHLGVYCVPAYESGWYPRYMYQDGHEVQKHHIETFGPLSDFNYHDFIPMFTLENFDAKEWAELYKRAGAKFAGPVAEHHDGFSMWDSKVNRWNAKDMGPKRDVVGELCKEIRKQDMKVITSFHHGFNLESYFATLEGSATADPAYADLYGKLPVEEGFERWLEKLEEVIDAYQPDQIWFDWGLRAIPDEYRRKFASYYYSKAKEWDKEVIITRKLNQLPQGVGVHDYEGGSARDIMEEVWQTDQSTGGHYWIYRDGIKPRPARWILHELVRVVSKNGVLLLNVCPDAHGNIPAGQKESLYEVGDWLAVNGEAIYGTRPWEVSGEGPSFYGSHGYYYKDFCSAPQKNRENIHYTQKDGNLYAICLSWPKGAFTFDKIQVKGQNENAKISLLGYGDVTYKVDSGQLTIDKLTVAESDMDFKNAYVFKIEGMTLKADPFSKLETVVLSADNATPTGHIAFRKGSIKDNKKERNALQNWHNDWDNIYWYVDVKKAGDYLVRGEFATRFKPAKLALSSNDDALQFSTEPRSKYGESVLKDYGVINFKTAGLQRIELKVDQTLEFPGIQRFYQIELAPVE